MRLTSTTWRVRAGALVFALLVTGLGLRTLLADIAVRPLAPTRPPVIYVDGAWAARPPDPVALPLPATAPRMPAAAATPRVEPAARSRVPASAPSAAPSRAALPASASASTREREREAFTAIAPPAADAASVPTHDAGVPRPLDLSPDVLRAAARDSKSSVRRMAETSGQASSDEPRSQTELVASSIARAGKPDCIGPKEGASLLSVFTIAYAALRDQCR